MKYKRRKMGNFIGILFVLTMNGLANALPINDLTTGEISDLYPVLFTPAGYVFSIWGLIYLLMIGFGILQFTSNYGDKIYIGKLGGWFFPSCILNGLWILTWHYLQIELSMLIIVLLLLNLIVIYHRLNHLPGRPRHLEKIFVRGFFSIYLAWVSVATIANAFIYFDHSNLNNWILPEGQWMIILLTVGSILALWFIVRERDRLFPLVFIWAYIGILVENQNEEMVYWVAPGVLAGFILISLLWVIRKDKVSEQYYNWMP